MHTCKVLLRLLGRLRVLSSELLEAVGLGGPAGGGMVVVLRRDAGEVAGRGAAARWSGIAEGRMIYISMENSAPAARNREDAEVSAVRLCRFY
jgi:hypothetical protein